MNCEATLDVGIPLLVSALNAPKTAHNGGGSGKHIQYLSCLFTPQNGFADLSGGILPVCSLRLTTCAIYFVLTARPVLSLAYGRHAAQACEEGDEIVAFGGLGVPAHGIKAARRKRSRPSFRGVGKYFVQFNVSRTQESRVLTGNSCLFTSLRRRGRLMVTRSTQNCPQANQAFGAQFSSENSQVLTCHFRVVWTQNKQATIE